jgi:hypothetical protein
MFPTFPRWSVGLLSALSVSAAWVVSALFAHEHGPNSPTPLLFGFGFGALLAIGSLLGIWTVFGPLAIVIRAPLALAISTAVVVTVAAIEGEFTLRADNLGLFGGFLFAQYLLVQIPLWLIVLMWRVRLENAATGAGMPIHSDSQFRIRHVMILTAGVAVVLSVTRGLIQAWDMRSSGPDLELVKVIGFIVLCNTTIFLPLALAALIHHRTVLACFVAWALVLLATIVEVPAFFLVRGGGPEDDIWFVFWAMNLTQASWVFATMSILRFGAYRIGVHNRAPAAASN